MADGNGVDFDEVGDVERDGDGVEEEEEEEEGGSPTAVVTPDRRPPSPPPDGKAADLRTPKRVESIPKPRSPSLDEFFSWASPRLSHSSWMSEPLTVRHSKRQMARERSFDALDAEARKASTDRALPSRLVDDGFRMPEFDYGTLARVSERPKGSGTQALVYAATIPTGTRAGEAVALKVLRPNLAGVESERRAFVREVHFLGRVDGARERVIQRPFNIRVLDALGPDEIEWTTTERGVFF